MIVTQNTIFSPNRKILIFTQEIQFFQIKNSIFHPRKKFIIIQKVQFFQKNEKVKKRSVIITNILNKFFKRKISYLKNQFSREKKFCYTNHKIIIFSNKKQNYFSHPFERVSFSRKENIFLAWKENSNNIMTW